MFDIFPGVVEMQNRKNTWYGVDWRINSVLRFDSPVANDTHFMRIYVTQEGRILSRKMIATICIRDQEIVYVVDEI